MRPTPRAKRLLTLVIASLAVSLNIYINANTRTAMIPTRLETLYSIMAVIMAASFAKVAGSPQTVERGSNSIQNPTVLKIVS